MTSSPTSNAQTQPSQIPPLPSPQTFTFLPQLYTLISHLAPLQPPHTSSQTNGTFGTGSRASRSPTLTRRPATSSGTGTDPNTATAGATGSSSNDAASATLSLTQTRSRDEVIELKDLPALLYPLRQQIERAKEVVKGLPEVERSVEEQEREIRQLEGRVRLLKGRLVELGRIATSGITESGGATDGAAGGEAREDVVMQGVEG